MIDATFSNSSGYATLSRRVQSVAYWPAWGQDKRRGFGPDGNLIGVREDQNKTCLTHLETAPVERHHRIAISLGDSGLPALREPLFDQESTEVFYSSTKRVVHDGIIVCRKELV